MLCDLDAINMCCWTHGVDITIADYCEGYCWKGNPEYDDDDQGDSYSDEEQ